MATQEPRVPDDVEEYLVGLTARAGAVGAGKAGARGGAQGARRLATKVEERSGIVAGSASEVRERVAAAIPDAIALPTSTGTLRVAVPLGRTGLNQIVVDIDLEQRSEGSATFVSLHAFGKEGLFNRQPTAKTADRIWAAVSR